MMRHLILLLSLTCCVTLFAQTRQTINDEMLCPQKEELIKDSDTQYWGTKEHHWRTHTMSFSNEITRFLGAQWNGANIGTIYCLYKGSELTFPIKLEFDTLAYSPNGGKWSKDLGQFKNCIASDQTDCPFIPMKPNTQKTLYEELDSLQKK